MTVAAQTGAGGNIRRCADMIKEARKIVVVHSPDRSDRAPGDLSAISTSCCARAAGVEADLILAYEAGNAAGVGGIERIPRLRLGVYRPPACRGAARGELLEALAGEIKAALVIGEDPMRHDRRRRSSADCSSSRSATGRADPLFADVALPMTTYLETEARG